MIKFTSLILYLICILILFFFVFYLIHYLERYDPFSYSIHIDDAIPLLKTGDLLLFSAQDAGVLRAAAMTGRWTHIGTVYKDPISNELFVIETLFLNKNTKHELKPLREHVVNYNHLPTQGYVAIRPLNVSLTPKQSQIFDEFINCYFKTEEGKTWNYPWKLKWTEIYGICTFNHIFPYLKSAGISVKDAELEFCTDGTLQILDRVGLLDSSLIPACVSPFFFQSSSNIREDHQSSRINSAMLLGNKYDNEILIKV